MPQHNHPIRVQQVLVKKKKKKKLCTLFLRIRFVDQAQ